MVRQILKLPVTDVQYSNIEVAIEWEVASESADFESDTEKLIGEQQKSLLKEAYKTLNDEAHGIIDTEATKQYQGYKKSVDGQLSEARQTIIKLKSDSESRGGKA